MQTMEQEHIKQRIRMSEQMGRAMGIIRYAIIHLDVMIKHAETATDQKNLKNVLQLMKESHSILGGK
jgi:mevalonate kinase